MEQRLRSPSTVARGSGAHSAAGSAAGYHFQIQRALLDLIDRGDDNAAISIETLDDLSNARS
jgi:hypothetical protein